MNMPNRMSVVGDLERPSHHFLTNETACVFWGEYTPYEHTNGQKWNFSPTNKLISNLKKKMDRRGAPDWQYKVRAIVDASKAFSEMINWEALAKANTALIPMPPSKRRDDPMFDPRIMQVLQGVAGRSAHKLDIRDCLAFDGRFQASHESDDRPSPNDLYEALLFDAVQGRQAERPGQILLFDDMLTSGAHFIAASRKLNDAFPGVQVTGVFVARRILPNPFADFDIL